MENPLLGWPPARDIKSLIGSNRYIALFESLDEALPIKRLIVGPGRRQSEDYEFARSIISDRVPIEISETPFIG